MAYYLDLFSPETYETFSRSDQSISGFRVRQRNAAARVKPGDKLLCYMTKLSRWVGLLEVREGPFEDNTPIFYTPDDPFVIRFHVRAEVWLPVDKSVPIHEDAVWNRLTFTLGQAKNSSTWTGRVRGSLVRMNDDDGMLLERLLRAQVAGGASYPVDPDEYKRLTTHRVRRPDKDVSVSVPEDRDDEEPTTATVSGEIRESIRIQALLAEIGARMGMAIWIPAADRGRVHDVWSDDDQAVLERLPLNYDDVTMRTI